MADQKEKESDRQQKDEHDVTQKLCGDATLYADDVNLHFYGIDDLIRHLGNPGKF
jgi:hypothetical protein